ncbi:Serine--tRNA ligase, partial [Dissostichus eleginoides]
EITEGAPCVSLYSRSVQNPFKAFIHVKQCATFCEGAGSGDNPEFSPEMGNSVSPCWCSDSKVSLTQTDRQKALDAPLPPPKAARNSAAA